MTALADFLLARIAEDEASARTCAEMFPTPWEVSDRGWRVRIYASGVPVQDLIVDDDGTTATRNPVVIEVEPDQHITDPRWLADRVDHIRRHNPAHVLAECEAKRRIVEHVEPDPLTLSPGDEYVLRLLAQVYADRADHDPSWAL